MHRYLLDISVERDLVSCADCLVDRKNPKINYTTKIKTTIKTKRHETKQNKAKQNKNPK